MPDDPELDDTIPETGEGENSTLRVLREKAAEAESAKARAQSLERENVLLRSGLGDLTDKQVKALTAAHDGDWTAEAVKATADELGFTKQPAEQQDQQVDQVRIPQEELDAISQVASLSGPPPPVAGLEAQIANAPNAAAIEKLLAAAGLLNTGE